MGEFIGENCYLNKHTLNQHDYDSNNGDGSDWNSFIKIHTISQYDDSSTLKYIDGKVTKGDKSTGFGFMNIHIFYQLDGLKS